MNGEMMNWDGWLCGHIPQPNMQVHQYKVVREICPDFEILQNIGIQCFEGSCDSLSTERVTNNSKLLNSQNQ